MWASTPRNPDAAVPGGTGLPGRPLGAASAPHPLCPAAHARGSSPNKPSSQARCQPAPPVSSCAWGEGVAVRGCRGEHTQKRVCVHPGECVCVSEGCSRRVRGVYGGAHTSEGWSSAWGSAQQGEGGSTSPVPEDTLLWPRAAWLMQGSPQKAPCLAPKGSLPDHPPSPSGNCILLLLLGTVSGAAAESTREELPAHPSHTDLAFVRDSKQ